MKRLCLVLATLAGCLVVAAPSAGAQQVTHVKDSFTYSVFLPAGTFCTNGVHNSGTVYENISIYGDPDNPARVLNHQLQDNFWTNAATGQTLTDTDHFTFNFNAAAGTFSFRGLGFHIKNAQAKGRTIAVGAGLLVFDANTGAVIRFTPHAVPDAAAFMCPLLDTSPA